MLKLIKKNNYDSWDVKLADFPKNSTQENQIGFLLNFALLAPSGHNSQPWVFEQKGNTLFIRIANERFLTAHDIEGRQSIISFGCLIKNLEVSGDYFNFQTQIFPFPNKLDENLIATIIFTKNTTPNNKFNHLAQFLTKRVSNREKYKKIIPSSILLNRLTEIMDKSYQITTYSGGMKNKLAEIVTQAQIEVMDIKEFRTELSGYVKSNFTSCFVGMPGFTLGIPCPVSFFANKLIKHINLSRFSKKPDLELLIEHSPIIVVFSSKTDTKLDWLNTGKFLENFWLECTQNNISCAAMAGAVQRKELRKQIQNIIPQNYYPQAILRCGYETKNVRHSPRIILKKLLTQLHDE